MIRTQLDNNSIRSEFFTMTLDKFLGDDFDFVLKGYKVIYVYEDGKKTDTVSHILYHLVDTILFQQIDVKVPHSIPIITQSDLDNADMPVFVSIPTKDTVVKPYKIEFGHVKVSITSPSISIVKD